MTDPPDKRADQPTVFDPKIQTENIAFDRAEMVACTGCGRMNPPTRLRCLYCAAGLAIDASRASAMKPVLRKLELWERGYNIICKAGDTEPDLAAVARLLSVEVSDIEMIIGTGTALPVARVEGEQEARVVQTHLENAGLDCYIVADVDLAPDRPPARLSRIDIRAGTLDLIAFNTGEVTILDVADLALLVPGLLVAQRVDMLEKKRRRGISKVIDETATSSDETILDIYTRTDSAGYRVYPGGFDFSCLGPNKGLLAGENLRALVIALKEHSPRAKLVGNYGAVRHSLDRVWELESRKDPTGLQRSGLGKREFGSVASTNNLNQFTRFSRLQWHLL